MRDYKERAGGQWVRPWSSLDHVRSNLMHARSILLRGIPQDAYPLLTDDEAALIEAINIGLICIERITS